MTETPEERPRPTPRPRATPAPRPSPRPRVAGTRRERDDLPAGDAGAAPRPGPRPRPRPTPAARSGADAPAAAVAAPAATGTGAPEPGDARRPDRAAAPRVPAVAPEDADRGRPSARRSGSRPAGTRSSATPRSRRRLPLVAVLAALCLAAAAVAAFLYWRAPERQYVDPDVFTAAQENMEAVYAYDYRDSDGSVAGQLAVLTGDLREQYEVDAQGALIDTYEQVSATIRYDVVEVGLQQVDAEQDEATLVVFGQLVAKSVNTGTQPAPEGSECVVTAEGEQSCVRTVQIRMVRADDDWRIAELTVLTTG